MSVFKIKYNIDSDDHLHTRSYQALTESTALDMFHETVESGSLSGETPRVVKVVESIKANDSEE